METDWSSCFIFDGLTTYNLPKEKLGIMLFDFSFGKLYIVNPSKLLSLISWMWVCIANHTKWDWYAQIKKNSRNLTKWHGWIATLEHQSSITAQEMHELL